MLSYSDLKQIWNDVKNDKIMKWAARTLFLGLVLCFCVTSIAALIRGLNDKPVNFLWGLYSSSEKDTVQIKKIDTFYIYKGIDNTKSDNNFATQKSNQEKKNIGSEIQNYAPNYGYQAGRDINNYGIMPRKITEKSEIINALNSLCPDKNKHIGFVAPASDGEILNVKEQIVRILKKQGYNDIENTNEIRIMIGNDFPTDQISLIHNSQGGFSFYIPPAKQ